MGKREEKVEAQEMSLEEAKQLRASRYKEQARSLNDSDRKEAFRMWWAQERSKYGRPKELEEVLWLHLKAIKMDEPAKFQDGINHFGLKKVD